LFSRIHKALFDTGRQVHIAPLVVFRMVFGLTMFGAVIRFWSNGWIKSLYIDPTYYFPYLGFEWIKPVGDPGMYIVFALMGIAALFVALGLFFRISAFTFFLLFTYVELIDKTPYLNHYYFICVVSFLLFLLPAHRFFSLDVKLGLVKPVTHVPRWVPGTIKLQLGLVYFFAGVAKMHPDWLLHAQPLKIWLPARADMPVIGPLLAHEWVAYLFSWVGLIFDLTIPFVLLNNKWRPTGYFFVVVFHVLTYMLFYIGMFPFVMIGCTLIFFSPAFHIKVITTIARIFHKPAFRGSNSALNTVKPSYKIIRSFLVVYFIFQLLIPMRYLLYPGNLFWTEQGFRFSWRVMLMEKSGTCTFYVCDKSRNEAIEINNREYLTAFQEKMMSTQPDMIVQFAHHLHDVYKDSVIVVHGQLFAFKDPKVYVDSYVTLNGRGNQRFIDPKVNLAMEPQSLKNKTWIMPFEE
jgi:hypothetical protein